MINKSTALLLGILINTLIASGQNYLDVIKLDYSFSPNNLFDDTTKTTDLHEINGELTAPIPLNDRTTFITGCFYEYSAASYDLGRAKEAVYGTVLKLGVHLKHATNWSGTYLFLPKLSSDLKKIGVNDFQFGGVALVQYTRSTRLNYKFGVYANGDKFGPFIVPLLGIYFQSAREKFEFKAILPFSMDLNYSFTKHFRMGINFKGQVRSYNLNNSIGIEEHRYLSKSTNDVVGYLQYGFKNGIQLHAGFGRSFARSYRIYDKNVDWALPLYYSGDRRLQLNRDFSDGWLLKVGIIYRIAR